MTKAFAVATLFLGAFGVALAAIIAIAVTNRVSAEEPRYRLDARYHNLPPQLVAELLAHPPRPSRSWIDAECREADVDGEKIGYCTCYGVEACGAAPQFFSNYQKWECLAPLGFVDEGRVGICRAERVRVIITG